MFNRFFQYLHFKNTNISEMLLNDIVMFLELNEGEKCQLVCALWKNTLRRWWGEKELYPKCGNVGVHPKRIYKEMYIDAPEVPTEVNHRFMSSF